ncbi:MAG: ABC transporter permease [Firmicutes bacterium]|nr:ABC transporter permease [Bacillota bacterium]
MAKYILKRCIIAIFTMLVLITIIFVLVRLLPGDPFTAEKGNQAIQAQMHAYYGLDKPLIEQWATYIGQLLHGNLGLSLKYPGRSVNDAIRQTFPVSASLGLRALSLALTVGIILGTISAQKAGKTIDYLCVLIAIIGVSAPDFIVGVILQLVFAVKLGWFPAGQWQGFRYTILPVFALSLYTIAMITRLMRSSMLEVINQDYILTAKAKGLSRFEVIWRHQLRNAILPVVTVMGPLTAAVLTGTFVIEKIFAIPGMGKFYVQSVSDLDYTMVLGMTSFYGLFLVIANLAVDVLYGIIDPRIKIAENKKKRTS